MNRRILLVDDNANVLNDYMKILAADQHQDSDLDEIEALLLGDSTPAVECCEGYETVCASQGQDALAIVEKSLADQKPFAMAFMDVRMPPGWDGIETTCRIWDVDPKIFVVICTAYSDHTWENMTARLGNASRFLILKKPFDVVEVQQLAASLIKMRDIDDQLQESLQVVSRMNHELKLAQRVKDEFLTNMNHELRTPLAGISGFVQMLDLLLPDGDEFLEASQGLHTNIDRLNDFVGNLLDVAAIKSGTIEPRWRRFSLCETFDALQKHYRELAEDKGLAFRFELDGDLSDWVTSDQVMLQQIVGNLLDNAVKFTARGSIEATITGTRLDDLLAIRCVVTDTGCGLDESKIDALLQPFTQADTSMKREYQGGGLGLSISKNLTEALGGTIEIESTANGCCVTATALVEEPVPENMTAAERKAREILQQS